MAWHALPVLAHAAEILGAAVGLPPDRLPGRRGPGEPRRAAGQRRHAPGRSASRSTSSATTTARRMWPAARLDDFAEFAYEPHGRLRRRPPDGPGLRRRRPPGRRAPAPAQRAVAAIEVQSDRVHRRPPGATASRIGAAHVVLAAGPWSRRTGRRRRRRPAGRGPSGPRSSWSTRAAPLGPVPVFSDLVSLQYVRTDGAAVAAARRQRPLRPRVGRPRRLPRAGRATRSSPSAIPKFDHRFPGLDGAALVVLLRRLLRRHARLQPDHLGLPGRRAVAVRRVLGPRLQDLALGRRAHGRPHRPRAPAATPTSTTATSAGSASPRRTRWSAHTPTSAPGRCAEPGRPRGLVGPGRIVWLGRGHSPDRMRRRVRARGHRPRRRSPGRPATTRTARKTAASRAAEARVTETGRRSWRSTTSPAPDGDGSPGPGHRQPRADPPPRDRPQRRPAGRAHRASPRGCSPRSRTRRPRPASRPSNASPPRSTCRSPRSSAAWPRSATPCSSRRAAAPRSCARARGPGTPTSCSAACAGPTSGSSRCWSRSTTSTEVFPLFQHAGIEILYMLSGVMEYGYGRAALQDGAGRHPAVRGRHPARADHAGQAADPLPLHHHLHRRTRLSA